MLLGFFPAVCRLGHEPQHQRHEQHQHVCGAERSGVHRCSFCSGSGRNSHVLVHLQQSGQYSGRPTAKAADHTYLNFDLQHPVVLTNPSAFPLLFCFVLKPTTLSKAKNQPHFLHNLMPKREEPLSNANHLKYTISGFLSPTSPLLFFKAKKKQYKKSHLRASIC